MAFIWVLSDVAQAGCAIVVVLLLRGRGVVIHHSGSRCGVRAGVLVPPEAIHGAEHAWLQSVTLNSMRKHDFAILES